MIILLVIVAFDLSFLVRYITRFTEESFAVLISVIFIYEACSKTFEVPLPCIAHAHYMLRPLDHRVFGPQCPNYSCNVFLILKVKAILGLTLTLA